jgi:hypothetical protein
MGDIPPVNPPPDPNSILFNVKKMLGVETDYDAFDTDIINDINSVLLVLYQIGVGGSLSFSITGLSEKWSDFFGTNPVLEAVKTYVYLKVRLMFDPPTSQALIDAIGRQITELEWRFNVQAEEALYVPPVEEGEYEC